MKRLFFILFYCLISFQVFGLEINQEFLNQFDGVTIKTIRKSETIFSDSNKTKSEFNGIKNFRETLGYLEDNQKTKYNTKIFYLKDDEIIEDKINTTWYTYGKKKGKQYFLYYQRNKITDEHIMENDIMLLGKIDNQNLMILIFKKDSQKAKELLNLFNLNDTEATEKQIRDKNNNKKEPAKEYRKTNELTPTIQETDSITSDTSNLKEHKDLKIYQNTKTNTIVIVGKATNIKDGDTIVVSDLFNVRLYGIDTPEKKQFCKDKKDIEYNCGETAKQYLKKIVGRQNITCVNNGNEKYGRFLFTYKTDKYNINQEMVKGGWALSYFNNEYKDEEELAKQYKLGMWQGEFERPEIWRKKSKNNKI